MEKIKKGLAEDETLKRTKKYSGQVARALPSATAKYAGEKVPILFWLPKYNPKWIFSDVIAGLTIGILLVPQGLSYAKLATLDLQFGLYSSWLPAAIYVFMGTSKGRFSINLALNEPCLTVY